MTDARRYGSAIVFTVVGLSIKEPLMADEVNFMSDGTPSLACITECTLIPPFYFPVLGCRPAPLNSRFENSVMVVESMI